MKSIERNSSEERKNLEKNSLEESLFIEEENPEPFNFESGSVTSDAERGSC